MLEYCLCTGNGVSDQFAHSCSLIKTFVVPRGAISFLGSKLFPFIADEFSIGRLKQLNFDRVTSPKTVAIPLRSASFEKRFKNQGSKFIPLECSPFE